MARDGQSQRASESLRESQRARARARAQRGPDTETAQKSPESLGERGKRPYGTIYYRGPSARCMEH